MLSRSDLLLEIAEVRRLTPRVSAYRLISPDGAPLPEWKAGAHLSVRLPSGRARCYSLCGDPAERAEYRIAVQREDRGEGGSLEVARTFARGTLVRAERPRNGFALAQGARQHLLLAGGIGITPIVAMIHQLRRTGAGYFVHACARSPEETAFREIVLEEVAAGRAALHHTRDHPSGRPDMAALVGAFAEGVHAYACGPASFLNAFERAAASWPRAQIHVESFAPETRVAESDRPFDVRIASTGETIHVPAGTSLLAALKAAGHDIATSCRQGLCGSCMVGYRDGEPDHRDQALNGDERREYLTVCCSRARSPSLTLDL
jgi:vanillate O-demethylase ferredoxin subunit